MTKRTSTPFSNRCEILGDFYIAYKGDDDFIDFFQYNDLGLLLSYAISANIVQSTLKAEAFVNETWDLLLAILELDDEGFEDLGDILPTEDDRLAEPF